MRVNNLPKVVTWQRHDRQLNSRPLESQANALTITPPGHTHIVSWRSIYAPCRVPLYSYVKDLTQDYNDRAEMMQHTLRVFTAIARDKTSACRKNCRCPPDSSFLWSPYVIGQTIIFSSCSFFLLLLLFFLPRVISAAVDRMSAILLHMAWP